MLTLFEPWSTHWTVMKVTPLDKCVSVKSLHLYYKRTIDPHASSAAHTTLLWRYGKVSLFFFSVSPPSHGAEARPQAVQCLINSRRRDRGRRGKKKKSSKNMTAAFVPRQNPALDPIVASLLIVDLTFCWDILLKDGAPGQKRISLQGNSEPSTGDVAATAATVRSVAQERKKKRKKKESGLRRINTDWLQLSFVGFFSFCSMWTLLLLFFNDEHPFIEQANISLSLSDSKCLPDRAIVHLDPLNT